MLDDGREGRRLRRLPRGPLLHAQDAQGDRLGRGRRDRRRDLGPLARDPPRAALGLVLGRPADRRRRDHRPRLPLHRDHPQLRRQGQPAGRGDVPHRHARPPDRRRGQRDRADPVRVRARSASSRSAGRSAAGWTCATRSPARTARSGSTTSCGPASRCSRPAAAAATSPRRPRRRPAGCSPSATRSPSSATSTCSATCSARSTRAARRARRSTTATSSTRSWTPPTARRRAAPGSRSSFEWRGGATPRIASTPETYEGQVVIKREILPDGRHKLILKDPAIGRLHRPGRRRRLGTRRWQTRSAGRRLVASDARAVRRDRTDRDGERRRSGRSGRRRSRPNGKIFAMLVKGRLVVKLDRQARRRAGRRRPRASRSIRATAGSRRSGVALASAARTRPGWRLADASPEAFVARRGRR